MDFDFKKGNKKNAILKKCAKQNVAEEVLPLTINNAIS